MLTYGIVLVWKGAAKVSIVMIGHQAIMDAYLCLLHLTAGILVGMFIHIIILEHCYMTLQCFLKPHCNFLSCRISI